MSSLYRKFVFSAMCIPMALASTASQAITLDASGTLVLPNLLADIDFSGAMSMYNNLGEKMMFGTDSSVPGDPSKHPIDGTMTLDLFSFGGTVDMSSPKTLFNTNWSLHGDMSAYVDVAGRLGLAKDPKCAGTLMCADADIMFSMYGSESPMTASFGMTPNFEVGIGWGPMNLRTNMSFDVVSIDADKDGVPGSAVESFFGYSPSFEGVATIKRLYFGTGLENSAFIEEVPPVPLPAAVWLFGSGLLALGGAAYRKREQL